jgi:Arc/MetJ-type ribon-helix-helix transcriptional regulator
LTRAPNPTDNHTDETEGFAVAMAKIAVTIDENVAKGIDRLVRSGRFPNRSKAVQAGLVEILRGERRGRLAAECAKLDPAEERALAEEAMETDSWPEY